jgi:hypothetical protein
VPMSGSKRSTRLVSGLAKRRGPRFGRIGKLGPGPMPRPVERHKIARRRCRYQRARVFPFSLAVGQPLLGGDGLALRVGPVAAGVVGDAQSLPRGGGRVRAGFAAFDMTAQRHGSAVLDRRHDLELVEADMAGMGMEGVPRNET